jgi:hypothetical protein
MTTLRMTLTTLVAGFFVAAPFGLAYAVDAHNHGAVAKKAQASPAKKFASGKSKKASHAGHMSMMQNCPMMQAGHAGKAGETRHSMMSGSSMSPRMQWHHNMMMWHHKMMHTGS